MRCLTEELRKNIIQLEDSTASQPVLLLMLTRSPNPRPLRLPLVELKKRKSGFAARSSSQDNKEKPEP